MSLIKAINNYGCTTLRVLIKRKEENCTYLGPPAITTINNYGKRQIQENKNLDNVFLK